MPSVEESEKEDKKQEEEKDEEEVGVETAMHHAPGLRGHNCRR